MFWWGGLEAGKVAWEVGGNGIRMVLQGGAEVKVKHLQEKALVSGSPLSPLPWDTSPPGVPLAYLEPRDSQLVYLDWSWVRAGVRMDIQRPRSRFGL